MLQNFFPFNTFLVIQLLVVFDTLTWPTLTNADLIHFAYKFTFDTFQVKIKSDSKSTR